MYHSEDDKYPAIYTGELPAQLHWRYGVPYHTRTGAVINDGDVIDGIEYTVNEELGGNWVTNKCLATEGSSTSFCPKTKDLFTIVIKNYSQDDEQIMEFVADRTLYSKQTIIVGYQSEIEKLRVLMTRSELKATVFHIIHDMCTVDDFRRAVKRACNNPGNHPMIFLGCLQEAVGAAMAGLKGIDNEHFIYIW
ncbi:hypothetical protein TOTORO_01670 [Serratia phage vB_SmaS-Totoro]|nr:hypothetical protein TOTORO_01670 [Serratia phage vB_SmaS-Totoro]